MKPDFVTVQIPRDAIKVEAPAPFSVTQKTSESLFGIPGKAFLALARTGAFRVTAVGSLRVALYADVSAYLEGAAKLRGRVRKAPAVEADPFVGLTATKGRR